MMDKTRRARRIERHQKRNKQPPLNLVSLMDIFTILVFFLLVNSSSSEQLPNKKELTLPTSVSENAPEERLAITVTKNQVLVGGRKVGTVDALMNTESDSIPAIREELAFYAGEQTAEIPEGGRAVTILADEFTPYELVSKILSTCRQSNYTNIAFAATQKAKSKL